MIEALELLETLSAVAFVLSLAGAGCLALPWRRHG